MSVTIRDVAREAGVAPSTVSYYLNESAPVSQDARKRIKKAIEKLNYTPNSAARSLTSKRSNQIGFFLTAPHHADQIHTQNNDTLMEMLRGINDSLKTSGYHLIPTWLSNPEEEINEMLAKKIIDGAIYAQPLQNDPVFAVFEGKDFPLVVLGRTPSNLSYPSIDMDNIEASYMGTKYLIEKGHKKIAFIAPCSLNYLFSFDRVTGYQRAMHMHNLEIPDNYIQIGDDDFDLVHQIATELLTSDNPPTAIVGGRDIIAAACYLAASQLGISVPDQLSIIGFDNTRTMSMHSITTIATPHYEIGFESTNLLMNLIKQPSDSNKKIFLSANIIERSSVASNVT